MATFKTEQHKSLIASLTETLYQIEFEAACDPIVRDILMNYEGFADVEKGPEFAGTPFDYFGLRGGVPYLIALKASKSQYSFLRRKTWCIGLPRESGFCYYRETGNIIVVDREE